MIALTLGLMVAAVAQPQDVPADAPVIRIIQAKPVKATKAAPGKCTSGKCGAPAAVAVGRKVPIGTTRPVGTPG